MRQYFLTGTYSEPILFDTGELFTGKGEGIYLCAFEDGKVSRLNCLKLGNPSFLAIDEERKHIYAVNEIKEFQGVYGGGLTDIMYDESGSMKIVGSFPTQGGDPCHVAISPDKRYVCVANFADGRVTVFKLDSQGIVLSDPAVFSHHGSSVHPIRQRGPHAHSILYSQNGEMFVPDLGIDQLKVYRLTEDGAIPCEDRTVNLTPGSGPRSGEWSKNGKDFYLINELGSSITHMRYGNQAMQKISTVSTLPIDAQTENICADLHLTPDGKYLYASNRGHDTIAMFSVDENGELHSMGWIPCGGKTPRNFAVEPTGRYVLVGNQDSDCIQVFLISENGQLSPCGKYDFPTPVCIKFFTNTVFQC